MKTWLIAVCTAAAVPSLAQHTQHTQHTQHAEHAGHQEVHSRMHAHRKQSPYAGMQNRPIKALSAQQVADLRAGKGMTLALAAELNGYPGPLHTLEMAEALDLSQEQKLKIADLYKEMLMEAKAGGDALIAREDELDRLFRERKATSSAIQEASVKAAHAQGLLRATHLKYHLSTVEILSPAQIAKYNQLRGYQ